MLIAFILPLYDLFMIIMPCMLLIFLQTNENGEDVVQNEAVHIILSCPRIVRIIIMRKELRLYSIYERIVLFYIIFCTTIKNKNVPPSLFKLN